jgi:hypothetical protein
MSATSLGAMDGIHLPPRPCVDVHQAPPAPRCHPLVYARRARPRRCGATRAESMSTRAWLLGEDSRLTRVCRRRLLWSPTDGPAPGPSGTRSVPSPAAPIRHQRQLCGLVYNLLTRTYLPLSCRFLEWRNLRSHSCTSILLRYLPITVLSRYNFYFMHFTYKVRFASKIR